MRASRIAAAARFFGFAQAAKFSCAPARRRKLRGINRFVLLHCLHTSDFTSFLLDSARTIFLEFCTPGAQMGSTIKRMRFSTVSVLLLCAITLTSGGLGVTKNVTISGPGANQLSINGNQASFVFAVAFRRTATISGLSITNGRVGIWNQQGTLTVSNCVLSGNSFSGLYNNADQGPSSGASMTVANSIISNNSGTGAANVFPFQFDASGGGCACMTITDSVVSNNADGIDNEGYSVTGPASLTVVNSNVSDNDGGGISTFATEGIATATIVSTTVSDNLAGGVSTVAGGLFGSGQVTITNSTISGNSSGDIGGGIHAGGFSGLSVVNSTISGNSAGTSGGGIYASASGQVSIVNSTISGNSSGTSGGGIYNLRSSLHLANTTISGNSAGSGGGIYNDGGQFGGGIVEISNTILNAGASGENIFNSGSTVTSNGYNLSSDDGGGYLNGPGDQINTDPLLGPLQDNGGPTLTHAPLPGSPAIDAGDPNFTPPPFLDQRGPCYYRVFGRSRRIDIGSVETQPERPCPAPRPRPTPP